MDSLWTILLVVWVFLFITATIAAARNGRIGWYLVGLLVGAFGVSFWL